MKTRIFILTVLMLLSPLLFAGELTPNEFLPYCDKNSSQMKQIICMYYFMGYTEGLVAGTYLEQLPNDFHVSPMAIEKTVSDYVQKNPIEDDKRFGKVILESLVAADKVKVRK